MDMIDQIIKCVVALIAFIATAWCAYGAIIGVITAVKHKETRDLTIVLTAIAMAFTVLFAWLGVKLIR